MSDEIAAFRPVPRTGVIYVTTEAIKRGFSATDPDWCNLGQGQPETGELAGRAAARARGRHRRRRSGVRAGRRPVGAARGRRRPLQPPLPPGHAVAVHAENVCISGGGRAALTRAAASLGHINLGHFLPDYTAYEELLDIFKAFTAIPILLEGERGYAFSADDLRREILGRGLSALLLSNPCNPTGKLVDGDELARWVATARELDCTLLLDEFYSHYIYRARPGALPVATAARYVEDVDKDPVVIFDGFTKNWRYPGWRVTWAIGPRSVIDTLASAGSFLDGGGSKPLQRAAIPLLAHDHVVKETRAIHDAFREKRDRMLAGLERLGVRFDRVPDGTFYCWGNVADLPPPLNDGMGFFRAALAHKVITVPGEFFDVNPGKRRRGHGSRFRSYVRFSFGPPLAVIDRALERIGELIKSPPAASAQT